MAGVWDMREQPILDAVARLSDSHDPRWEEIQHETGLSTRDVQRGLRTLYEADYLTGNDLSGFGNDFYLVDIRLLERGLVQTGVWPGDPYDELIGVLREAIAAEGDAERRSKLQRLLDATVDIGKGVASGLLVEGLKRAAMG
jgi:hypothetical protein